MVPLVPGLVAAALSRPPDPRTARERATLVWVSIFAAISRCFALSRSPWDWDEILFALGLHHFNVTNHHPHPPGFPLYLGTAKLLMLAGLDDFHALQTINMLAAVTLVPAMFFFCHELRLRFSAAISASLLLAFFPNVWFFGGTAFSDVPSLTLSLVAIALLLRGCRDGRAYLGGAVVLAISAGYRPQNLLIAAAPALISTAFWIRRDLRRVIAAAVVVVVIVGVSYGTAAWLTGWQSYREALAAHQRYITQNDSFRSPGRPSLVRLFDHFFLRPYRALVINVPVSLLALVSCIFAFVRPRMPIWIALATFGPFCLFAWLTLDYFSVSRFSIAYMPLIAILAADGLSIVARRAAFEAALTGALVLVMIVWTWPALQEVRKTIAPPIVAVQWIRAHLDRRTQTIYVHGGMVPYADRYLADYHLVFTGSGGPAGPSSALQPGFYLFDEISERPDVYNFVRPPGRLWDLVRRRYFGVSVQPVRNIMQFGSGWYEQETVGWNVWHWMSRRGVVYLAPVAGRATLSMSLYVPLDVLQVRPTITVTLNGARVDRFREANADISRTWQVNARSDGQNELIIETDRIVNPAAQHLGGDPRDLGLRLNSIGWTPAH
jgi:hypothetical protein